MAASYFTISLSPNIEESNDGSLICRDAVLGRTGWQTYRVGDLPQESAEDLGIDLSDPDAEIDLYRPAEEVFHPDTLSSIEGKTVTDDHPHSEDGNVNPDNFKQFACGHVQNVRRGKEPLESGDYPILGDVHIKAEPLLSDVRNHIKRELSLGYDYQIKRNGKRVDMHHITVNHCAVVPRGRAGREARINDSELPAKKGVASRGETAIINKAGERKPVKLTWKHIFGAGIKAHAADAEPEELADAAVKMASKHADDLEGFMEGGEFHPIRNSEGYKRTKGGDPRRKRRRAKDASEESMDDDRKRDRVHDALDCLMDGRAKDTDLDELRDLLDEFFEEEQEEPEHEEDRGRDRRGRDKRGRDSRKARDRRADDGDEDYAEEAEQNPKIDTEHLRKALSKDESEEREDEHEHEDEESHEDDSTHEHDEDHEHDSDENQNKPISEDWKEGEPEDDQFEEDRARDKREKARDRGRAHDGALGVLKTFRPFVARSQDKALRAAYDAALKEIAKASKPRSAGYGEFAARARAHDNAPRVSSEVKQAQELDSIFEKARTEGRK